MTEEKDNSVADTEPERAPEAAEEAENYRRERNRLLRRGHALETILKTHGISFDFLSDSELEKLPIHKGAVDGVFDYKAPDIKVPPAQPPARTATPAAPTLADVKTWSQEKIADNWDMIKELMKKGAK